MAVRGGRSSAITALAFMVVALVAWGSNAPPAAACSCAGAATASERDREAFDRAVAVFTGTVANYEEFGDPLRGDQPVVWTFAVDRVYKGEVAATQTVGSIASGAACGLEIPKQSGTILVFASDRLGLGSEPAPDGPLLHANLCGGTRAIGREPVLAGFGEGEPPGQGPVVHTFTTTPAWRVWAPAGLAVVAAVSLALLAGKLIAGRRRAHTG